MLLLTSSSTHEMWRVSITLRQSCLWPTGLLGSFCGAVCSVQELKYLPWGLLEQKAQIGEISTGGQCRCCFPGVEFPGRNFKRNSLFKARAILLNSEELTAVLGFQDFTPKKEKQLKLRKAFQKQLVKAQRMCRGINLAPVEPTCKSKLGWQLTLKVTCDGS